jgi:uncharacterized sulfatase
MKDILPILSLLFPLLSSTALQAEPGARPNIVLILSDEHSYGDYSFMGHKHIKTPHLDKLARESVLFKRGYVSFSRLRSALAVSVSWQS